jgi:hypothetical protein
MLNARLGYVHTAQGAPQQNAPLQQSQGGYTQAPQQNLNQGQSQGGFSNQGSQQQYNQNPGFRNNNQQ